MTNAMALFKTPLYLHHVTQGARMVDFGGWLMPVQFKGILAEHAAVRERTGIFDISHMGQIWIHGTGAEAYLQNLITNDIASLETGKGCYALMCRDDGGVVDDLYVYRLEPDRFLVIVNASRAAVDLLWMRDHLLERAEIVEQPQQGALALQGPRASDVVKALCGTALSLPRNAVGEYVIDDMEYVIARTGYTGEDGFEIFAPGGHILHFYGKALKSGEASGITPCGLGARDTLRLEMGYRLYGQDLDEQHTALESGLGWVVKLNKENFIGKQALEREKTRGSARRFIGFALKERGVPRHGYSLYFKGKPVGEVTSGTFSPSLQRGIGMGYVENAVYSIEDQRQTGLIVKIHDRAVPVETTAPPFYRKNIRK